MNDKWNLFQKFLITENSDIYLPDLLINSAIVVVMTFILQYTYTKCAKSLSNKKSFANNFLLLTFTTMIIITIVKSSLALSLGLVGALSIVRFRAAIKEPEELSYLFFTIAIGLGLGANQRVVVIVAFVILMVILWAKHFLGKKEEYQNLFITVTSSPKTIAFADIQSLVASTFSNYELKRLDEDGENLEASFYLDINKHADIVSFKEAIQKLDPSVRVAFIDNKV